MRLELLYSPGCRTYQQALHHLEMAIAEERLPIPVELVEDATGNGAPRLRIDGETVSLPSIAGCIESLSDLLMSRWREIAIKPLLGGG